MDNDMRMMLSGLLLTCSLIVYAGNGMDSMTIELDANNPTFTIKLPANPTTGYQWTVEKYDKKILQLMERQYIAPQTNRIGAGGEMMFAFKSLLDKDYPKSTQIIFKYARPWEPNSGTVKRMTVYFKNK